MTEATEPEGPGARYSWLWNETKRRWRKPWADPSFVIYFFLAIVGLAGLGFWIELYKHFTLGPSNEMGLRTALFTLFPALAGTTALNSIWAEGGKEGRALAMLCLAVATVLALIVGQNPVVSTCGAIVVGVIAWLASLQIWWIANADNPSLYRQELPPMAAIGGADATAPLSGDLDDFQH